MAFALTREDRSSNSVADLVEFNGIIDSIRFVGNGGFAVLAVRPQESKLGMALVTVAGILFEPHRNDRINVKGEWNKHPRFGMQIKADVIEVIMPDDEDGIYKLLKSKKFLPGVGAKTAKLIVDKYGKDVFRILEESPQDLLEIKGISKKKLDKIVENYSEKIEMRGILQFCAKWGIPQNQGEKIHEIYGGSAVSVLSRNPYLLTEGGSNAVKGIGFKKADSIALAQGLPTDSKDRIIHGIMYALDEQTSKKGSTAVIKEELVSATAEMLNVSADKIGEWLEYMLGEDRPWVIEDDLDGKNCIWNKYVYSKEKFVANKIFLLQDCSRSAMIPHDIPLAIEKAETLNKIRLADSQRRALEKTLKSKVGVITGGPGVGKTTIMKCLIDILEKSGNDVVCAAPTGRAAKRMQEATKHESSTIHRMLEFGAEDGHVKFKRNAENPLEGDVFIIDEFSMVDTFLMASLLEAIPPQGMVVFVGDVDQLPSVGAGKVLEDLIKSKAVVVSRLETIFRQAAESKIITAAHEINAGHFPAIENNPNDDFFFIEAEDNVRCASAVLKLAEYIPRKFGCDPLWDVQILSPKKGSEVGTVNLNMLLQEKHIPDTAKRRAQLKAMDKSKHRLPLTIADQEALMTPILTPMVFGADNMFAEGDKVMQTVNDYSKGVFNGDVGQIEKIYPEAKVGDTCAVIAFQNDKGGSSSIPYTKDELFKNVSLSYACTIHKSQGSEYPYVIMPIMPTFSIMLQRKLIYTGVTRGKKMVVLVGSKESLGYAVHNHFRSVVGSRKTKLKYWLSHRNEVS